jgi:RND family efflux transporter MFP subunit
MTPDRKMLDQLRIDRAGVPQRALPVGLLWTIAGGVVVIGLLVWWLTRPGPVLVRTEAALQITSSSSRDRTLLNASGYVTARRAATVSSKVTGKVMDVLIEEGQKVEQDQVLAHIDSSNAEKTLQLAEAQLESAKKALGETRANIDRADSELRRIKDAGKAVSEMDLDRAVADAKAMHARLERQTADVQVAEKELAMRKQELDDTVIRAPFAGIVISKDSQPGEMISPISAGGGFTRTGICTIVDMSSLEIEVDVSESYINRVEVNQPVTATLDSYPNLPLPAKVIAIIPTADRQKATVKVRVGFDKLDPRILPDMSVKAAFQAPSGEGKPAQAGAMVPKSAIRQKDGRSVVWVVSGDKLERRAVSVGGTSGDNVMITAGLSGGERVVVEGPPELSDGMRVTEAKK